MNGQRHDRRLPTEFAAQHEAIFQLMCELNDVLDDRLDAETDTWSLDPIRDDRVGNLVATLISKLRTQFAIEERADADELVHDYTMQLGTLHQEHVILLESLDYLFELTGSPCRPAST